MADRVSARRTTANNFFLAVNAAVVTAAGLAQGSMPIESNLDFGSPGLTPSILASAAGIVLSAAWWLALRSYRDLNRAKFDVILKLEAGLPTRIFTDEWSSLKSDDLKWWRGRYAEQGTVERVVPFVFIAIYSAVIITAFAR